MLWDVVLCAEGQGTWVMGAGDHQILLGKAHLGVVVGDKPATETFMQLSADKV